MKTVIPHLTCDMFFIFGRWKKTDDIMPKRWFLVTLTSVCDLSWQSFCLPFWEQLQATPWQWGSLDTFMIDVLLLMRHAWYCHLDEGWAHPASKDCHPHVCQSFWSCSNDVHLKPVVGFGLYGFSSWKSILKIRRPAMLGRTDVLAKSICWAVTRGATAFLGHIQCQWRLRMQWLHWRQKARVSFSVLACASEDPQRQLSDGTIGAYFNEIFAYEVKTGRIRNRSCHDLATSH